jgi:hypothetical protein
MNPEWTDGAQAPGPALASALSRREGKNPFLFEVLLYWYLFRHEGKCPLLFFARSTRHVQVFETETNVSQTEPTGWIGVECQIGG